MTIEAILASLHLLAILTFVVFVSSQAALCRSEWMSAAVVQRLARLDMIYGLAVVFLDPARMGPARRGARYGLPVPQ